MKKLKLILFLLLIFSLSAYSRGLRSHDHPSIYIHLNTHGKELTEVGQKILNEISSKLTKRIPCARIKTRADMLNMILADREKALSNSNYESKLPEILAETMGSLYLISVTVMKLGTGYSIDGRFTYNKCKEWVKFENPISENTSYGDNIGEFTGAFTDAIATDLLAQGFCPLKGEFNIESSYTLNDLRDIEYNNNCGLSKTENTTDNATKWIFKKSGSTEFDAAVDEKIWIKKWYYDKNDCSKCSQLDEKGKVIGTLPGKYSTSFSELKQESATYKLKADSSIISFIFNKDNTYHIRISATAPKNKVSQLLQQKEINPCPRKSKLDNYDKYYLKSNSIDRTFGPYEGSIFDKELKLPLKTEVFKTSDGKGINTESIEFHFTR